jgi:hypothetical protein
MPERDCIKLARIAGAFGGIYVFVILSRTGETWEHVLVAGLVFGLFCGMITLLASIIISLTASSLIKLLERKMRPRIFPCGIPMFKVQKRESLRMGQGKLLSTIAPADSRNRPNLAESPALLSKVKTWDPKPSAPAHASHALASPEPHRQPAFAGHTASELDSPSQILAEVEAIMEKGKVAAEEDLIALPRKQVDRELLESNQTKLPSEERIVFREELFDLSLFARSPVNKPARKRRTRNRAIASLFNPAPATKNDELQTVS